MLGLERPLPYLVHNEWLCVQWGFHILVSVGWHIEWRTRRTNAGVKYGPYVDFHLIGCVVSVGRQPAFSGDLDSMVSYSRGGVRADS